MKPNEGADKDVATLLARIDKLEQENRDQRDTIRNLNRVINAYSSGTTSDESDFGRGMVTPFKT